VVTSAAACGSATSSPATLTITGSCCTADIASPPDGFVNTDDLIVLITSWGACANCTPPSCPADIAPAGGPPDCLVNTDDLIALITSWGACP
jgi:hypothetical protein